MRKIIKKPSLFAFLHMCIAVLEDMRYAFYLSHNTVIQVLALVSQNFWVASDRILN